MKRIALVAAMAASPAVAQESPVFKRNPAVISFNGYSVTVIFSEMDGADFEPAMIEKASELCASVDRDTEFQWTRRVSAWQVEGFFVCV